MKQKVLIYVVFSCLVSIVFTGVCVAGIDKVPTARNIETQTGRSPRVSDNVNVDSLRGQQGEEKVKVGSSGKGSSNTSGSIMTPPSQIQHFANTKQGSNTRTSQQGAKGGSKSKSYVDEEGNTHVVETEEGISGARLSDKKGSNTSGSMTPPSQIQHFANTKQGSNTRTSQQGAKGVSFKDEEGNVIEGIGIGSSNALRNTSSSQEIMKEPNQLKK